MTTRNDDAPETTMTTKASNSATEQEIAEVAAERKRKGVTLRELSEAMGKGDRPGTLSSLSTALSGKRGVSRKFLDAARRALGMPPLEGKPLTEVLDASEPVTVDVVDAAHPPGDEPEDDDELDIEPEDDEDDDLDDDEE